MVEIEVRGNHIHWTGVYAEFIRNHEAIVAWCDGNPLAYRVVGESSWTVYKTSLVAPAFHKERLEWKAVDMRPGVYEFVDGDVVRLYLLNEFGVGVTETGINASWSEDRFCDLTRVANSWKDYYQNVEGK